MTSILQQNKKRQKRITMEQKKGKEMNDKEFSNFLKYCVLITVM